MSEPASMPLRPQDPLDDLIADLERLAPTATAVALEMPPVEDHCYFNEYLLSRDPERGRRLADDPRVKRVQDYYERVFGVRLSRHDDT